MIECIGDSQLSGIGQKPKLMEEEGFLSTLDFALTSYRVSELESIDALTPRVRDLSINIR